MADKVEKPRQTAICALGTYLNGTVEDEEPYDARVSRTDLRAAEGEVPSADSPLRAEGAYRRGQQGGHGALDGDVCGQRVGRAYAARSAARGRTQGVGRWRLSGPDEGDPAGRTQGPGHDLQENQVQELCR